MKIHPNNLTKYERFITNAINRCIKDEYRHLDLSGWEEYEEDYFKVIDKTISLLEFILPDVEMQGVSIEL